MSQYDVINIGYDMMTNEELEIAKVGWNVAKDNLEYNL